MQRKFLLPLVAAALVAGLPDPVPEPEPDPDIKYDVKVDSGDSKADSYFQVVETDGQISSRLITKLLGKANGDKCCKVQVPFSWPVQYKEYENGATDVPCGGRLAGVNGTCVDGNVVCEIDNMGTASNKVTFEVDNEKTDVNKSITVDVVPGSSFFDVMLMAEQMDDQYSFTYEVYQGGVYVTGIDGVKPHIVDGETWGWVWSFYNCTEACTYSFFGVSETYPNNGDIWQFRYNFVNWTSTHSG